MSGRQNLISDPAERRARNTEKLLKILAFLREECWSNIKNISDYMECSTNKAAVSMRQLAVVGFVRAHKPESLAGYLYGITVTGLMKSFDDGTTPKFAQIFEPSKLRETNLRHHLDLQRARIFAERGGWIWTRGNALEKSAMAKIPDAIAISPDGERVAIELERTLKTAKRYEVIFSEYLQAIRRGELSHVQYLTPEASQATSLRRLFGLISAVSVQGRRVPIGDEHRAKMRVSTIEEWSND